MSGQTSTAGDAPAVGCTKYASQVPSGVVMVTSDFHLPRALWLAAHLGLDAEGVAASSDDLPRRLVTGFRLRELGADQRALLDVWLPPANAAAGPRERTPDG